MKKILFYILIIFLTSCAYKTNKLDWGEYSVIRKDYDGGMTTDHGWKIYLEKKEESKMKLIFSSYSWPHIEDIMIDNNRLLIKVMKFIRVDSTNIQTSDTIIIKFTEIDCYIANPVEYDYGYLTNSNDCFQEPYFLKRDREIYEKYKRRD